MANLFKTLEYEAYRAGINPRTKEAQDWFRKRVRTINRVNRLDLMDTEELKLVNRQNPLIGSMNMFFYDAKHKDTLPYYDKFPLAIIVGPAPGGFYGLNLHYIPPRERAVLMDELNNYATNNKYDETTRLKLSYDLLKGIGRAVPCVKRYLGSNVRSNTVRINADEWEIAIFLPVERFQKQKKSVVWNDSKKYY